MPSLFRFLFVTGTAVGLVAAVLLVLADYFEPSQREIRSVVPGVKARLK